MHCSIIDVLGVNTIFGTGCSNVALFEEIKIRVLIIKNPNANVKLPVANEEWSFYVLLDNKSVMLYLKCTFGWLFRRWWLFLSVSLISDRHQYLFSCVGLRSFLSGELVISSPPFCCFDFFFQDSSSLPTQYSLISLWRVGRSLKTWIPLPRFRCVGFKSQRLKPSKWLRGHESLVCVLFSKLKDLNFVAFWFMPPWPLVL